jgi:hypothetical protein
MHYSDQRIFFKNNLAKLGKGLNIYFKTDVIPQMVLDTISTSNLWLHKDRFFVQYPSLPDCYEDSGIAQKNSFSRVRRIIK